MKKIIIYLIIFFINLTQAQDFQVSELGLSGAPPSLSCDSVGNFVVTWTDGRNAGYPLGECGDDLDIYAQMFNYLGKPIGKNFRVSYDTNSISCSYASQGFPSVAMNNKGNFVIVWQDNRTIFETKGNKFNIYCEFFDSSDSQRQNILVNEDTLNSKINPKTILWEDNSYLVFWMQNSNESNILHLYAQSFNTKGEKNGKNIDLAMEGKQYHAEKLSDSSFIIIVDSLVQIFSKDFSTLIQSLSISTGYNIHFATTNDSLLYVVSSQDNYLPSNLLDEDIYIQKYNLYNNIDYKIIKINDDADGYWQTWPRIAIENNNIIVVWHDFRNSGYKFQGSGCQDIYGQRFNLNLERIGNNFKVSHEQNSSSQGFPSVILRNNRIVSVWGDGRSLEYLPVSPPKIKDDIWGTLQDFNDPLPGNIIPCIQDTVEQDTINKTIEIIRKLDIFPQPTSNKLNISIKLNNTSRIKIIIYDILGNEVLTLFNDNYIFITFDHFYFLNNLSSGIYIINVLAFDSKGNSESKKRKLVIIK